MGADLSPAHGARPAGPPSLHYPTPAAGHPARVVAGAMARSYRHFAWATGAQATREAVTGERIRPDRVISAFDGDEFLGFLSLRFDRTGPFTIRAADFRRVFGAAGGSWRGLAWRLPERREKADEAFIEGLLVLPAARSRGLSRSLLDRAAAVALANRKRCLRLRVRVDNDEAIAAYGRYGFVREGRSEVAWMPRLVGEPPVDTYVKRLALPARSP